MILNLKFLYFALFFLFFSFGDIYAQGNNSSKRPFYEYKGNYGEEIASKKSKFKSKFGYNLVDMGRNWSPVEIDAVYEAFDLLPLGFHKLPGLNSLYRLDNIVLNSDNVPRDDIPAATLPSFSTIFENISQSYRVFVEKQELRVELYNPLFHEDRKDLINIIQHEMAHAFDLSKGFLSFSDDWISLTKFKVIHIFALDGVQDSDSLYALVNDPRVNNYAPIARRNISTYSRQNPQEDFANSVTAYIHYPYFRYTHSARYEFLKKNVFDDKEYFINDPDVNSFEEKVNSDIDKAFNRGAWADVSAILVELSRGYFPEFEKKIINRIKKALGTMTVSLQKDKILGLATCYLMQPEGLDLRKKLIRDHRISVKEVLKDPQCLRYTRDTFEKQLSKWAPSNLYFYQDDDSDFIQFVDPVLSAGYVRGFDTEYVWKIFLEGEGVELLAEGSSVWKKGGNGSVVINLQKSSTRNFELPQGKILRIELMAKRTHPINFKSFVSERTGARFIVQPWFSYIGPNRPQIRVSFLANALKKTH
jgi:hypothetical protein